MNFLTILTLLPAILRIVHLTEELITEAKQGKLKKEIAISLLEGLIAVAIRFGVLKNIKWEEVKPFISESIDLLVSIMNKTGVFKTTSA